MIAIPCRSCGNLPACVRVTTAAYYLVCELCKGRRTLMQSTRDAAVVAWNQLNAPPAPEVRP